MSTRPTDSVFGVPEPPGDGHRGEPTGAQPEAPVAGPTHLQNGDESPRTEHAPGTEVEWTNAELHSIAGTIEELQRRLEQANSRLSTVASVETTEFEIGRLFVEAQR